ncbi:MAG TPA: PEP-utilizing enzyme, partial [Ktedonobacterales bacterium]|nr:PEP-utilizing enzyme [Ktedonobacterales bacterium]
AFALSVVRPELGERALLAPHVDMWRTHLLPEYQLLIASQQAKVEAATPEELTHLVDQVATAAGTYLWSFSLIGGHAWKVERSLARFYRKHLVAHVERSHQELLRGLIPPAPQLPQHAVQSLDWIQPTAGESVHHTATTGSTGDTAARYQRLQEERRVAEHACREALADRPRLRRRFETLLALAQRYAVVREEQAAWFTLGWPVMRRAALRLGEELRRQGMIASTEDVFFLSQTELSAHLPADEHEPSDLRAVVAARQKEWQHQRRLTPPLILGKPAGAQFIMRSVETMRTPREQASSGVNLLTGMPASPGRATGSVRIVRRAEDFGRFQAGEVLVAQVTAPAWTPLFERAAAVVTDGGSVAAHASLVAREYGIPAVVGTGDATARLHDGQQVTVDGSAGVVEIAP